MKSVSQLLSELELLREQNEELRAEVQKLRSNQPQYFRDNDVAWWFRKQEMKQ